MRKELRRVYTLCAICVALGLAACSGHNNRQESEELPEKPGITLTLEPQDFGTATRALITRFPADTETTTSIPTITRSPSPTRTRILPNVTETPVKPKLFPTDTPFPSITPTSEATQLVPEAENRIPGMIFAKDGQFWKTGENGNAEPFIAIGMNRYNLLRDNEPNNGCGNEFSDDELEPWFSGLHDMGVNVVRLWAFQDYMQEPTPDDTVDNRFDRFDKLLDIAGRYNIALLPVMRNQWTLCDDSFSDPNYLDENGNTNNAWFEEGYKVVNGLEPVSYREYVKEFTQRYKGDPRIFAIGLMNEPEGDFAAMYDFADDITGMINGIDPNRLTTLGTLGGGQPGSGGEFYKGLGEVPNLDILEFHDYTPEVIIPGDEWNGPRVNLDYAHELNKPIIIGELGITAGCVGCYLPEERAEILENKIEAYVEGGADGIIIWSGPGTKNANEPDYYEIDFDDPAAEVIYTAAQQYNN